MARAIGYVRVSTEEQSKEGLSLESQEAKIRGYAELNDLELQEVIRDEGQSAKDLVRPGAQDVLRRVRERAVEAVIVYKLDRLSRSALDTLSVLRAFEDEDVAFHSVTERIDTRSATGRFFVTITAAFAQMEREMIAERTRDALRWKLEQGEPVGTPPLGFSYQDGELVPVESELEAYKAARNARRRGLSYREVAERLNARELPTKRGGRWHGSTVRYILKNRVYKHLAA